jgi:hypothetical protein
VFAEALARRGRKVFDRSIVVSHVAPHTLGGFWHQQKGRGRGAPYVQHCVMSRSLAFLATKILIKSFYRPLKSLIEFPWFFVFYCCSRQKVHYGYRDFFPFVLAKTVEIIAHRVGEWKGLCEIAYGRVGR